MSFLSKGLEKLIDREIREIDLISNPLRNELIEEGEELNLRDIIL